MAFWPGLNPWGDLQLVEAEGLAEHTRIPQRLLRVLGKPGEALAYHGPHTLRNLDLFELEGIELPLDAQLLPDDHILVA